jgi:hypothetical protein
MGLNLVNWRKCRREASRSGNSCPKKATGSLTVEQLLAGTRFTQEQLPKKATGSLTMMSVSGRSSQGMGSFGYGVST